MSHLLLELPYRGRFRENAPESVSVFVGARLVRVQLDTGEVAVTPSKPEATAAPDGQQAHRLDLGADSLRSGVIATLRETRDGPETLFARDGRETLVPGQLRSSWSEGDRVVAIMESADLRLECVAFVLGRPVAQRLYCMTPQHEGSPVHRARELARLSGSADDACCVIDDLLHLFRFVGGEVRALSLALPGHVDAPFMLGGKLRLLAHPARLLVVDLTLLDFSAGHAAQSIAFERLRFPREADDLPATVTVAIGNTIMLEHPRYGQVRTTVHWDDAPLTKGEQVMLDDVREELPGIYRVHALRRVGAGPERARRQPDESGEHTLPEELSAVQAGPPALELYRGAPEVTRDGERLEAFRRHGVPLPARLLQLLRLRDGDPVFARWLRELDFLLFAEGITRDWDADPNLIGFLSNGGGDNHALYFYPPWCAAGHEPPVVDHNHETRETEFCTLTFDAFLEQHLRELSTQDWLPELTARYAELVALVRERLDFPVAERPAGEAPAWLTRAPVESPPARMGKGPARWFQSKQRLLQLERALLAEFWAQALNHEGRTETIRELRLVYEKLGWTLALENLRTLAVNHPDAF